MSIRLAYRIWRIKRYFRAMGGLAMKRAMPMRQDLTTGETEVPPYGLNWKGVACSVWRALEDDDTPRLESYLTTYAPYFSGEKQDGSRSACVDDAHLEYLDAIHSVAMLNMYGAGINLREEFGLTKKESREVLGYWMKTAK